MRFLRCHISGFGQLAGFAAAFQPGLNLLFAPNEGGKSTLQQFLVALLYGQLRPDAKLRKIDWWVDKYRPWAGAEYGGTLWCELAAGRELEIRREFGKDEHRIEVRTATGEDITAGYDKLKTGEILFGPAHLGMSKDLFESVAVIREDRTAGIEGRETVRDRISNLAQSGQEDLSVHGAIRRLELALEAIGSERAPTKPLRQAMERLADLRGAKNDLEDRRREFEGWLAERAGLDEEIARLDRDLARARRETAAARLREAEQRVRTLEEIQGEIESLSGEMDALGANPDFPAHRLEELSALRGGSASTERRLEDVRKETAPVLSRLRQLEEEMRPLAAYGALHADSAGERISESFHKYLALALQRDNAQRALSALQGEIHSLEGILESRPVLRDSTADWERLAREAAEAEAAASERSALLSEGILAEKMSSAKAKARISRMRLLGAASLILGALAVLPQAVVLHLPPGVAGLAALMFVVAGLVFFLAGGRFGSAVEEKTHRMAALAAEQERCREEARAVAAPLNRAVAQCGFATVGEFLSAAKEFGRVRDRLGDMRRRMQEAREQLDLLAAEAEGPLAHLKEALARVGLACSPANLSAMVDTVRTNLRRYRDLSLRHRGNLDRSASLQAEENELQTQLADKAAKIREILEEGGVGSMDQFRDACRARQRLLQFRDREVWLRREFQRVCEGEGLESWRERVRRLEEAPELTAAAPDIPPAQEPIARTPLLPYLPGLAEAEQEEKQAAAKLASAREDRARISERLHHAFSGLRSMSEIEEDIALAEAELSSLQLNRAAIELALEAVLAQSRLQQEVLAPQLNRAVEKRFLPLCTGRYAEVKIDPDFVVRVREAADHELREADSLSRGTQDQLYFALRFGVLELVSNPAEVCPCLLDEPFAAYDRDRIAEAFRILQEEAQQRQLLLFTCREDVRDLATLYGAAIMSM